MSLFKRFLTLLIISSSFGACKKDKALNLEDKKVIQNDSNEVDYNISGTKWTPIADKHVSEHGLMAMTSYKESMILSFLYFDGMDFYISGSYNGKDDRIFLHDRFYSSGGVNTGINKFIEINGVLFGVGNLGENRISRFEDDGSWASVLKYDQVTTLQNYKDDRIVGFYQSPYLRAYENGGYNKLLGKSPNGRVAELVEYNGKLIAGGVFKEAGGVDVNNVSSWDGTSWKPLGKGLNGRVRDLVVYNDKLIATGDFEESGNGNKKCRFIAEWDGSEWKDMQGGLSGGIRGGYELTVYKNQLFVGGHFDGSNSISSSNIIKWDGNNWITLGNGVPDHVEALCIYKNQLYVSNLMQTSTSSFLLRLDK